MPSSGLPPGRAGHSSQRWEEFLAWERQRAIRRHRLRWALLAFGVLAALALGTFALERHIRQADKAEQLHREIRSLQHFVEAKRGMTFRHTVTVRLLNDRSFDASLPGEGTGTEIALASADQLLHALGIVSGKIDYSKVGATGVEDVAGYYRPARNLIAVRGTRFTPFVREVLVHELTHAVDDETVGLPGLNVAQEDGLPPLALTEGDATYVEREYLASLPSAQRFEAAREQAAATRRSSRTLGGLPPAILALGHFPYEEGERFVAALAATGGNSAINAAFEKPPTSSADILHPGIVNSRRVADVPTPQTVGEVVGAPTAGAGVIGEFRLRLMLAPILGEDEARSTASSWAGDRFVSWFNGETTCVHAYFEVQSAGDHDRLASALRRWTQTRPGGQIDSGDPIGIVACA